MEPKQSMSRYAGVVVVALVLRAVTGAAAPAAGGAVVLLLTGAVLDSGYRMALRRGPRPAPAHRQALDRLVRQQWMGAGLASLLLAGIAAAVDLTLWDPPRPVDPMLTATAVAALAVFISSLIDWHWILPRMGGITRLAPCEEAGGQKWARVTGVWLFHRAAATLIVAGAVTGVAIYMQQVETGDEKTFWLVLAGLLGAATLYFQGAALRSLWLAFNPKLHVGDILDIHGSRAYIVDVSLQGAKYRSLNDASAEPPADEALEDPPATEPFSDKWDGWPSLEDFGRFRKADDRRPPCAKRCQAINWYCRHNHKAYE